MATPSESGEAVLLCLSQRPFTKESIQAFAEKSRGAPATLVSDGLGCFSVVRGMGILHEPHVTGGVAASAKHPAFQAVNTVLDNIKTSLVGTYHAFEFRKSPTATSARCSTCSTAGSTLRVILDRTRTYGLSGQTVPPQRPPAPFARLTFPC